MPVPAGEKNCGFLHLTAVQNSFVGQHWSLKFHIRHILIEICWRQPAKKMAVSDQIAVTSSQLCGLNCHLCNVCRRQPAKKFGFFAPHSSGKNFHLRAPHNIKEPLVGRNMLAPAKEKMWWLFYFCNRLFHNLLTFWGHYSLNFEKRNKPQHVLLSFYIAHTMHIYFLKNMLVPNVTILRLAT